MSAPPTARPAADASDLALQVRGLRKRYGSTVAVDGLDLEVRRGECFGLLGPNGAGKTTTIEICEGLNTPDEGDVTVLGRRWATHGDELRERLGIQLQETQLSDKLTVAETVGLFRSFYATGRPVDECIALVQLGEKRDAQVRHLSGGQKQRLALACAVVGDPELLFLDEPTTGLDPQSRRQLWDLIEQFKAMGRTIVLTTHYMDEAERLSDRVAIVDHGRIIALGTPWQLIAQRGADHVVEFATDGAGGDGATLDADVLATLAGVRGVRRAADRWVLDVTALHATVPALLAELARRGLTLEELATHSATLEDVFVSLTGRQLRDA
ncbi:MAG TPA: ABC transporter ATP-binding protein [Microbacterium sp.]|nr:ABC transporter ATP-binding protein [Microbacterium sp.]